MHVPCTAATTNYAGGVPEPSGPSRARLHVVTGKGGTGKTTVAAALALHLAAGGRSVLLAEVEGRQGIAPIFDVAHLDYTERRIATAPGGGEVHGVGIEPKAALLEYLEMFYRLGGAGKVLEKFGAIDFATTVAPGVRDVLLTGKVYEAVRRRDPRGRHVYDAVVLDGPPTGRIGRFLNVNEEVVDLAKVGPIRNQAESIMAVLRSPQAVVHMVTVLEEMPVQETHDGMAELRRGGLRLGHVIVNQMREPYLPDGAPDRAEVAAGLLAAGLGPTGQVATHPPADADRLVDGLLRQGRDHAVRVALEQEQLAVVHRLGVPVATVPSFAEGIDRGGLYELAEILGAQLAPGAEQGGGRG